MEVSLGFFLKYLVEKDMAAWHFWTWLLLLWEKYVMVSRDGKVIGQCKVCMWWEQKIATLRESKQC